MQLNLNQPPNFALLIVVSYFIFLGAIVAWKKQNKPKERVAFLWKLIALAGLLFSLGLVAIIAVQPQSLLNNIIFVVYDLIISYALIVELPSYWKIAKYDDKLSSALTEIRGDLISMRYSSKLDLDALKKKIDDNKVKLEEEKIRKPLTEFLLVTERLRNINDNLWSLTLAEISKTISSIDTRSKHPFPKLIDILALSGLSILIAEFLKILG